MLKNLTTSGKVNLITEGQSWMLPDLSVRSSQNASIRMYEQQ